MENQSVGEAGGVYLFRDLASAEAYLAMHSAEAYLAMHSARLKSFGIVDINANIFAVNEPLSRLNRWPE
ncbi:YdhR family protein [Serratia marcescens]|uniref:YdhR family protein n=1 Tax=Serratia marcescens TaxID=615 RepID=UPI00386D959F